MTYQQLENLYYRQKDYDAAFDAASQLAKSGDVRAKTLLAWMYYRGDGCEADSRKGEQLLRVASELGDREAAYALGVQATDRGDYADALRCFESSAAKNFPPAQYRLGLAYYQGYGVSVDRRRAANLFKEAAENKNLPALRALVTMNRRGQNGISGILSAPILLLLTLIKSFRIAMRDPNDQRLAGR